MPSTTTTCPPPAQSKYPTSRRPTPVPIGFLPNSNCITYCRDPGIRERRTSGAMAPGNKGRDDHVECGRPVAVPSPNKIILERRTELVGLGEASRCHPPGLGALADPILELGHRWREGSVGRIEPGESVRLLEHAYIGQPAVLET